jgi:hypothetical protein
MLRAKVLGVATLLLLAAAPFPAESRQDRLVPPQPIPHVAHTAARRPIALPLPRARPAPTASSPASVAPNNAPVPIND